MKFTGKEYFRAAVERMQQAREIHGSKEMYALAMYCSGLAVECMLRAFRWKKDKSFEGRHDLEELLAASDLLRIHEDRARRRGVPEEEISGSTIELQAAMNGVVVVWHNNLRFASEASLLAFLHRVGRLQGIIGRLEGIKGNALKKNSADLLNAAQLITDQEVILWTSKKK